MTVSELLRGFEGAIKAGVITPDSVVRLQLTLGERPGGEKMSLHFDDDSIAYFPIRIEDIIALLEGKELPK